MKAPDETPVPPRRPLRFIGLGLRRFFGHPMWRRPVPLWQIVVIVLIGTVGFTVALHENATTAREAAGANQAVLTEIAARQHDGCVASNQSRQVLRDVVNQAYASRPPGHAPADPALKDQEVVAYIQRLLDGNGSQATDELRAKVLAKIPTNTNCTTIVRH